MNPPCGLLRRELTENKLVDSDQRCIAKLSDGSVCGQLFTQHPYEGILLYIHFSLWSTPESFSTMKWRNCCPVCVCRCLIVLFEICFLSLPWVCLFPPFHGFALHIIRISSNTIGTRLIVSVTAAGRIISCDSCMWCRFSVLVYTGTTMLLACFVFFCVLPFLAFPCSSWFFFSTALLCTPHISISDYHSELPFCACNWNR